MAAPRLFGNDALKAIHNSALGRYRAGSIDAARVLDFEKVCLVATPPVLPPADKHNLVRETLIVGELSNDLIAAIAAAEYGRLVY